MNRTLKELQKDNCQNLTTEEIDIFNHITSTLHKAVNDTWPNQYREAFDMFLKYYGWHIRLWMSLDELIPFIKEGNDAVNQYLIKNLRWSTFAVRNKAMRRFPHRKKMISAAFFAHWRGDYFTSIPLFLLLSEGIFREISGGDMFSKHSKPKAAFIETLKNDKKVIPMLAYIIEAVTNGDIIALKFSNDDYKQYPHVLSRNRILHGVDYQYANSVNAYKALSQFEFVIESVYMAVHGIDKHL